ncbi:hypothetical protein ACFVHW_04335 [Streptomyces sp. NPDC127110]|uniref:hypothetical protein n=1 Tax=Streptomyces sp. NPDC127110 TaxID=3345362 RepID=UPI0036383136
MLKPSADFRVCQPREATADAYTVTAFPESALVPGTPNPRLMSGALVRALLISAGECGGAVAMDELTDTVVFTYAAGMFHRTGQMAVPLTADKPMCGTCGQWETEHRNPNASCCDTFNAEPAPGSDANPWCRNPRCGQPRTHHGRRHTVACSLTPHRPECECRTCLCTCEGVWWEPEEKCMPDCDYMTAGQLSEHCYPPAYEYRITYF